MAGLKANVNGASVLRQLGLVVMHSIFKVTLI